jgi:hypothetical protein
MPLRSPRTRLIAAILLLAKLVAAQAGNGGLFLLAAISGIADAGQLQDGAEIEGVLDLQSRVLGCRALAAPKR